MSFVGKAIGGIGKFLLGGGLLGLGAKALLGKKKGVGPAPIPTRDDARAQAERDQLLARRRGAAADIISGASGEPGAGQIGRLVVGS